MPHPIIFDFDGVIVDSELLASRTLAECLTNLGYPTTAQESLERYTGQRLRDSIEAIERRHACRLPADFPDRLSARFHSLRTQLNAVSGAIEFVRTRKRERTAIASSSRLQEIKLSLHAVGLGDHFDGRIFSAADIERGKPHPDIFLKAATGLGEEPHNCVVIEDSPLGVEGAVAAGMTVIGLTAASHCGPNHAERLTDAGAHTIARSYADIASFIARL